MHKIYVIGARLPYGGTHMAYHVGRIAAERLGGTLVNVELGNPGTQIFAYTQEMETITLGMLKSRITADDLLICNPSFSGYMFGLRLPGKKLMYVQDFLTFKYLDCGFDAYVAVSTVVARFLDAAYGIKAEVIPAFIDVNACAVIQNEYSVRPTPALCRFAVHLKYDAQEHRTVFEYLKRDILNRCGPIEFVMLPKGGAVPHHEFLRRLADAPYLLNICIAEGFGLVPLEAMAMGKIVVGLDGASGRDYMQHGKNSLTVPFKEVRTAADKIYDVLNNKSVAAQLSINAVNTAKAYSLAAFEMRWQKELEKLYGRSH